MNISEIAMRARVSTATVSRTLNKIRTVDPRLARRVWAVVNEHGYYPNTQARSLVCGRSRIFGLIISEITNPFFPEIVRVFEDIAVENNYEILLSSTANDPKRMEASVRRMIERRVDAVAVLTFGMEEGLLENLKLRNIPLVFVDAGAQWPRISNIRIDYMSGIRQAVQHLAALRHRRIAFITGPLCSKSALSRKGAFVQSVAEIGLQADPDLIIEGDHTIQGGMAALDKLITRAQGPTAIMCSNDMTAIGVMGESYVKRISIPRELSVIGFDDIRFSQFVLPPLTTVRMSQSELARLAFHALLSEVERESPSPTGTEYVLSTSLIQRNSTARASE